MQRTMWLWLAGCTAGLAAAGHAWAIEDFEVRVACEVVTPRNDPGTLAGNLRAEIDSANSAVLGATVFFTPQIALDLNLAPKAFEHRLELNDLAAADVDQRPLTLQAQYYFRADDDGLNPFLGLGYAWTKVEVGNPRGSLTGARVAAEDGNGIVLEGGLKYEFDDVFVRGSVRYQGFESEVQVNGARVGTLVVDPWVIGLALGYSF